MRKLPGIAVIAFAIGASAVSIAQDHADHAGHAMTHRALTDAVKAYEAANAQMHKAMAVPYTGNPDVDFVRGMIPHHQGATDMAKVVLKYGKDPEIRKLAEDIIVAQEKEIAWMAGWLKKQGQ
jgi:uncharacterized protein (DUF305 family)